LTDTDTVAINVAGVNDPPVNTVPAAQLETSKDQDLILSSLRIADPDAGNNNVQVTLSLSHGTLTIAAAGGVTVTGNSSASLGLTGSVTAINSALAAGVTFRPPTGFTSPPVVVLTMVTNDLGNTGGPAQTDTDTVNINVRDFAPSTLGGGVFVDSNGNGVRDAGELGVGGLLMRLTGQESTGVPVNLTTLTLPNGRYSFTGLKPGTYTVEETQPAGLRDGVDLLGTGFISAGNDRATITIPSSGGLTSDNTLFGELGLRTPFLRASDLLASSARPDQASGVLFGTDGLSTWSSYRGDGWDEYDGATFTIISRSHDNRYAVVTLTARHTATNTNRSVTIDSSVDPRLIFMHDNGETVIRFKGRPDDLFASAEGEAAMSSADYARGVDEVMAQGAVEIA
jgi:hypothetical protein